MVIAVSDLRELRELQIKNWNDIADDFTNSDLLLGNGFSLNFSSAFNYGSLFDEFLKNCKEEEAELFSQFGTTNFESIQEQLLIAKRVNQLFDLSTDRIEQTIGKLRHGLITSVQSNHPYASEIETGKLDKASEDLEFFKDVFTTNYDLFLYRIIMLSKDKSQAYGASRCRNDYFWEPFNENYLEFKDFDLYGNKYVYYLHGALFLFPGYQFDYHSDLKLKKGNTYFAELMEAVSGKIAKGNLPLFVSEGSPEDKMRAISRSTYLTFAYRQFEASREPLTIYGWSASPQDNHILSAISSRKQRGLKKPIAISIYVDDKSYTQLKEETHFIKSRLSGHNLTFFDASTLFAL